MREAAGVPAASCDVWLFRFRILIQRVLDELNEELFLLEVMGCQIVFQPLEEFCGICTAKVRSAFMLICPPSKCSVKMRSTYSARVFSSSCSFSAMIFAWSSVGSWRRGSFFPPSVLLLSSILQAKHTGRSRGKLFTKPNEEAWRNRSDTTKAAMPPAEDRSDLAIMNSTQGIATLLPRALYRAESDAWGYTSSHRGSLAAFRTPEGSDGE